MYFPLKAASYHYIPTDDHMSVIIPNPGLSTAAPDRLSFCFIPYQIPQSRVAAGLAGFLSFRINRS